MYILDGFTAEKAEQMGRPGPNEDSCEIYERYGSFFNVSLNRKLSLYPTKLEVI